MYLELMLDLCCSCRRPREIVPPPPLTHNPGASVSLQCPDSFWVQSLTQRFQHSRFQPSAGSCFSGSACGFRVLNAQQLQVLFSLIIRTYSAEVYTSNLVCCSHQLDVSSKDTEWDTKQLPTEQPTFRPLLLLTSSSRTPFRPSSQWGFKGLERTRQQP